MTQDITALIPEALTDVKLEKISVITDIDKLRFLMDGKHIDAEDFDTLYDKEIGELVFIMDRMSQLHHMSDNARAIQAKAEAMYRRREDNGN